MSDKTREAFEAWAYEFNFNFARFHVSNHGYASHATSSAWLGWSACAAANAQEVKRLREALTRMCRHFPTDDEMMAAGWPTTEVNAACDAYDFARAALQGDK